MSTNWKPLTIRYDIIPPHLNSEQISEESILNRIHEMEAPAVNSPCPIIATLPTVEVAIDFEEQDALAFDVRILSSG